ncbi:membrane protein [Saccharospirillum salsuginis]|uniref:Membrane protein n=2 Tax=Saccharospirillum salsuginis TaxID=418750 RepID=A0A918K2V2_9GAMM|nr:membrane protein [Saccharospirillum salsuginis]
MQHTSRVVPIAAVILLLGVALGAFGSHALADRVIPARLDTWDTAVLYQLVHGLGLLLVALLGRQPGMPSLALPAWSLGLGVLFFSGSLYGLVLLNQPLLGAVTPLGGVLFLIGWGSLAWQCWRAG